MHVEHEWLHVQQQLRRTGDSMGWDKVAAHMLREKLAEVAALETHTVLCANMCQCASARLSATPKLLALALSLAARCIACLLTCVPSRNFSALCRTLCS
jgi:hypothetical protein